MFLEISLNSEENTFARASFLQKLQVWGCSVIKKETLAQAFSCEFSEISKNTFSYWTPLRFLVNFVKFLRTPFYIEHLWWLLLKTRKVFMQKQPSKGFFKKGVMRNFVRVHKKTCAGISFLIKLNCRSAGSLKTRP